MDLAVSPARYYLEKEQQVTPTKVEFSGNAENLLKNDSKEKASKVLSHIGRLRVLQSIDTDGAITQYSSAFAGDEVSRVSETPPREDLKAAEGSSITTTPTSGRKIFFKHENLGNFFQIPGATEGSDASPILSAKGVGSPFFPSHSESDLRRTDHITGLTGSTNEAAIEKELTEGEHLVEGLSGEQKKKKFHPGRLFLGSTDITHISTKEGNVLKVDDLDKTKFPLLTEENKPKALFHVCWSRFNYDDVDYLKRTHAKAMLSKDEGLREKAENKKNEILLDWTQEIGSGLENHPDFHESLQGVFDAEEDGGEEKNLLVDFWSKYFSAQLEKDYTEAQVIADKKLKLGARHSQNYSFGGQQDFEGSYRDATNLDEQEVKKGLRSYQWSESMRAFQNLFANLFKLMSSEQVQEIKDRVTDQIGEHKNVDADNLGEWLNDLESESGATMALNDSFKEVFSL